MKNILLLLSPFLMGSSLYGYTPPSPELAELCENDNASACYAMGMNSYSGLFQHSDPKKAFGFFSKACELEDNEGCFMVARYYYTGDGVKKDTLKAKNIMYNLCEDKGYKHACASLSEIEDAEKKNKEMKEAYRRENGIK